MKTKVDARKFLIPVATALLLALLTSWLCHVPLWITSAAAMIFLSMVGVIGVLADMGDDEDDSI